MASLQNSPSIHRFPNSFLQLTLHKHGTVHCGRRGPPLMPMRVEQVICSASTSHSQQVLYKSMQRFSSSNNASYKILQDGHGRRQLVTMGVTLPCISLLLLSKNSVSFAAEAKKGFLPILDRTDGYSFLYPFGWQEVAIAGQDKVFKDVIEPLESVSVNLFPTIKQDLREFGPPQQVAETLIKKVLAPSTQNTKLIEAAEHEVDGKIYYRFEFVAQAPNYTRHALSTICIGNGKFYTLTTGANERRWGKMKDKLQEVIESFKIFNV